MAEFKGLTSTVKQKAVLAEVDLARAPLTDLSDGHDLKHELVARLLAAMKAQTSPVPPRQLGAIGKDHIRAVFERLAIQPESFDYRRIESLGADGLPQLTEIAFAAGQDKGAGRHLIAGVNWSAAWVNPFRRLGNDSLDALLSDRRLGANEPIFLLVHVACPRVQYGDRGKSSVMSS
jgi:hypothetical protein